MSIAHGIKTVAIIGSSGQMGAGIAYVSSVKAQIPRVLLCDLNKDAANKGLNFMESLLMRDVKKGRLAQDEADKARERWSITEGAQELGKGGQTPDMVIEAATENLPTKLKIFKSLATALPISTILATNTSSISVSKIAAAAVLEGAAPGSPEAWQGPKRALGLHFFNPVPIMSLVELVPALQTSPDIEARARAYAVACGKTVTTAADAPGFVSNRLLMPYINEAIMALEAGIASREDIDATMKLGCGHKMGPLETADMIGLDTCLFIMETLQRETGDSKYRAATMLGRYVDAGWLGRKSGKGIYDYAVEK